MTVNPLTQARQLELLADEAYDAACETLGNNHDLTIKIMMIMARSFALYCDIEGYVSDSQE